LNIKGLKDIDWQVVAKNVSEQFKNLDTSNPGVWPILPRVGIWVAVACGVIGMVWYALITSEQDEFSRLKGVEGQLRDEFVKKTQASIDLENLKKQKIQVQAYVSQLENQLPGRAEVARLLSDVNQIGVSKGLQFDLFRPSPEVVKTYYAERAVNVVVVGRFHDMGEFSANIARLPRIVSLSDLSLGGVEGMRDVLKMEAVVRTYRYLDDNEVEESKKVAEKK